MVKELVASLVLASLLVAGCNVPVDTTWEYTTVEQIAVGRNPSDEGKRTGESAMGWQMAVPPIERMNALGADHWELVGTYLEMETAWPNFGNDKYVSGLQPNVRPQRLVMIFKRPKRFSATAGK